MCEVVCVVCVCMCRKCHVHHFPSVGEFTSCFALHTSAFLPPVLPLIKWLSCLIWALRTPSGNHLIKEAHFICRSEVKCCLSCNASDHPRVWLEKPPCDYSSDRALQDTDNILLILNPRRWSTQSANPPKWWLHSWQRPMSNTAWSSIWPFDVRNQFRLSFHWEPAMGNSIFYHLEFIWSHQGASHWGVIWAKLRPLPHPHWLIAYR